MCRFIVGCWVFVDGWLRRFLGFAISVCWAFLCCDAGFAGVGVGLLTYRCLGCVDCRFMVLVVKVWGF